MINEPSPVTSGDSCAECAELRWFAVVDSPRGDTAVLPPKAVAYWKHAVVEHRDFFDRMVKLCRDANAQGIGMPRDVDGSFLAPGHNVGDRYRPQPTLAT